MAQAIEGGVESFGRLAFEVGYFTERQLRSIEAGPGPLHVRRNESADEVVIRGLITPSEYRSEERSVRVALDGVRLPYKEWIGGPENPYPSERAATIVRGIRRFFEYYGGGGCGEDRYAESLLTIDEDLFDDTARQLVDVYAECARGRVLPAELLSLVDKILSQEERQKLLEELWEKKRRMQPSRFPPVQALEDAFYNSSLDYDQYRYARRLFDIDADLLDDPARRIKGVYVEVAYGKLDAAALAAALDEILRDDDRERLLAELEAKQADAEQARRTRVAELLAAARRCASPAEGHKALALLAEAMTIDSSNNEVFELMRNVSAFYQGQVVTNSIGMQLVWIPAGEFVMGKKGRPFDTLVHKVRVSGGFWMGVREVRQAQYEAVMATNPSTEKAGARPVTDVSWNDAVEFCRRLSEKEGKTYRLPTEAEWEYAYRAGTNTDYWWGDDEHAIPDAPNPFGLLNMHGGVREWCQDWHSNGYYFVSPDLDPPGPAEPEGECVRVVRGDVSIRGEAWGPGWWRGRDEPVETHRNVGFRVVLDES
ncbi:MAG: formylglycine-generating enzyme family protein [Sedimentisphaerales bacterium]|nr:formylglycine-generating enzyme family protein [Sedimentisphaerales bacterium]